jgi:subtilisin family serine protease
MPRQNITSHKLHPWLRVIRNGSRTVNAVRSDGSTRVASSASQGDVPVAAAHEAMAKQDGQRPGWTAAIPKTKTVQKRGHCSPSNVARDAYVNVFIELFPEPPMAPGEKPRKRTEVARVHEEVLKEQKHAHGRIPLAAVQRRNMISATIPVTLLDRLEKDRAIAYVHPAEPLKLDRPAITAAGNTPVDKAVGTAATHGRGKGLIIGIIDVGGFDFAHEDFLDAKGRTRFLSIWDQGGKTRDPPTPFDYGSEIRQADLNAALAASRQPGMPPATQYEKQSQQSISSHGTHVASIAAGNSGVCPEAEIAAVLLDVPTIEGDFERRRATFSDTSRITHAVEYLLDVATRLKRPISINISLGTNGGSHDGSGGVSRWLDAYLATPGRAICVAAGNAGQEKAEQDDDLGFMMGRIHTSGEVKAQGLEVELEWTVIGDGLEDLSENELEIWYGAQDRFSIAIKPPKGSWIRVEPGEFIENRRLKDGTFISVYNELYHPTTGGNYIAAYLSPNLDPRKFRGIAPGVWKVRLYGKAVRDGRFDAWIERDDPMEIGREGARRLFRFPSFFTEKTNVDSHSITSLACGHRVIAVANLDDALERINISSSQGPTRDGRCKPEIAAPGTNVVAANGFASKAAPYIAMTGTSMASPYVTGVVGLMMAAHREEMARVTKGKVKDAGLTAAQCIGILQRTARPLPGGSYKWVNDMGFGRIRAAEAIEQAKALTKRLDRT